MPFLALAGWLGMASPALAEAPSTAVEPTPAVASSVVLRPGPSPAPSPAAEPSPAAPGHSLQVGVGVANNDVPVTELGYVLHWRRIKLGVVGQLGVLRYASIAGTVAESGVRLRGRLPVWLRLAEVADGRLRADLLLAPGVRRLAGEGRSATALTLDTGLQATVRLGKRVTLATAVILPVAIDVAPTPTLSRFPGLTLGAGAWVSVTPRVSIGAQGFASAPEGYGGDSEKSALEASLGVRIRLGSPRAWGDAAPLLNASI